MCIINKSVIDTCLLLTSDLLTSDDFVFAPTNSPSRSKIFLLRESVFDVSSLVEITDFIDDVFETVLKFNFKIRWSMQTFITYLNQLL